MKTLKLLATLRAQGVQIRVDRGRLRVSMREGVERPDALLDMLAARKEEVIDLLSASREPRSARAQLRKAPAEEPRPLSFSQSRFYFLNELEGPSSTFNLSSSFVIRGDLNEEALSRAVHDIQMRHEILRSSFRKTEHGVEQFVDRAATPTVVVDALGLDDGERDQLVSRLTEEATTAPFDLKNGPHIRVVLVRLGQQLNNMLVVMHHIVSDGHSIRVFVKELESLYRQYAYGTASDLEPVALHYSDYAYWQSKRLAEKAIEKQEAYWRRTLDGAPDFLELGFDSRRPDRQTFDGASLRQRIPESTIEALTSLNNRHATTLYHALMTAYALTLSALGDSDDIVIGSPAAMRQQSETRSMLGPFLNMIPLRVALAQDDTLIDIMRAIKQTTIDALDHAELPFERIVNAVSPARSPSYSPIFQHMLALEDVPFGVISLPGLRIETKKVEQESAKYDLTIVIQRDDEGYFATFRYNKQIYTSAMATAIAAVFESALESVASQSMLKVRELDLATTADSTGAIRDYAEPVAGRFAIQTMDRLFVQSAARWAERQAVSYNGVSLTYKQLDEKSNRIARALHERGIGAESVVALALQNSIELIIAIIGVHKSGAAYVPVSLEDQKTRVDYSIRDSGAVLGITTSALRQKLPDSLALLIYDSDADIDAFSSSPVEPSARTRHALNVLYTSGSTGEPKAVVTEHEGLVNNLLWMQQEWPLTPQDVVLYKSPLTFDVSLKEIMWPLLFGARLVVSKQNGQRDPRYLLDTIRRELVTVTHLVPTMLDYFIEECGNSTDHRLRIVMCGGEALSIALKNRFSEAFDAQLLHLYGPTEAAIAITGIAFERGDGAQVVELGRPTSNSSVYVLDRHLRHVPVGTLGQIYIGGKAVARGYLNKMQRTASAFVPDPFIGEPGARMYATGDFARLTSDGKLLYAGRDDNQIKLRGQRLELGEIETCLRNAPRVNDAVVTVARVAGNAQSLIAHVAVDQVEQFDLAALRHFLTSALPRHMWPASYRLLVSLPMLSTGKVDRAGLARQAESAAAQPTRPPSNSTSGAGVEAIWCELLDVDSVDWDTNFFEVGGHSILALDLRDRLSTFFERPIDLADIFANPTIAAQIERLGDSSANVPAPMRVQASGEGLGDDIAIIGMAARFPGSASLDEFWQNIRDGHDCTQRFSAEELHLAGVPGWLIERDDYVPVRGVIDDLEMFDGSFFGFNAMEANLLDPQHRILLECAQHAFDDAGIDPSTLADSGDRVGVFVGVGRSSYFQNNIASQPDLLLSVGTLQASLATAGSYAATQIAYRLNLTGPAEFVDTACSTSLVAVHRAVNAILSGDAEMALAGGASVDVPTTGGYLYQPGGVGSQDGKCRPFDEEADGTVKGMGGGLVLLKRLDAAVRDGDPIHAVIKGMAVNNDGSRKVGFTAPGLDGQSQVIQAALSRADVPAESIGFIETHGTGTALGDPIEVAGLKAHYGAASCALGATKANIGHLDTAAGIAGLIKSVLVVKHGVLPPISNFSRLSSKLDLSDSGLRVVPRAEPWASASGVRRAAVSSFGLGGTNAHAIIEQAPAPLAAPAASDGPQLCVVSAKSPAALDNAVQHLGRFAHTTPTADLRAVASTLATGRAACRYRASLVASDLPDLARACTQYVAQHSGTTRRIPGKKNTQIMCFPGQGTDPAPVVSALYASEPVFTAALDECIALTPDPVQQAMRALVQGATGQPVDAVSRVDTDIAQPWVFSVSVALARSLIAFGVRPDGCVGHSLGAFAAAHIAGAISLEDGVSIVVERGRLMARTARGAMLVALIRGDELPVELPVGCEISAFNSPGQIVISGPEDDMASLSVKLDRAEVRTVTLDVNRAFHSSLMDPILPEFEAFLGSIDFQVPQLDLYCDTRGCRWGADEKPGAAHWVRHIRQPVRFDKVGEALLLRDEMTLVNVGAGSALTELLRASPGYSNQFLLSPVTTTATCEDVIGKLWEAGFDAGVDNLFKQDGPVPRVRLPHYAFDRQRHWIDAPVAQPGLGVGGGTASEHGSLHAEMIWCRDTRSWPLEVQPSSVIVVHDGAASATSLAQALRAKGAQVIDVPMAGCTSAPGSASTPEPFATRSSAVCVVVCESLLSVGKPTSASSIRQVRQILTWIGGVNAELPVGVLVRDSACVDGREAVGNAVRLTLAAESDEPLTRAKLIDVGDAVLTGDTLDVLMAEMHTPRRGIVALRDGQSWRRRTVHSDAPVKRWQRTLPAAHECRLVTDHVDRPDLVSAFFSSMGAKVTQLQGANTVVEKNTMAVSGQSASTIYLLGADQNDTDAIDAALDRLTAIAANQSRATDALVVMVMGDDRDSNRVVAAVVSQHCEANARRALVLTSDEWHAGSEQRPLLDQSLEYMLDLALSKRGCQVHIPEVALVARMREAQVQPAENRGDDNAPDTTSWTAMQKRVMTLWASVLGQGHYALDDNFFAMGGDSLAVNQLVALMTREFSVSVMPADLKAGASIRSLADLVEAKATEVASGNDGRAARTASEDVLEDKADSREMWEI